MASIRSRAAAVLGLRQPKEEAGMYISEQDKMALDALGLATATPGGAGTIAIDGVMESVVTASFDFEGQPCVIVSRRGHALGTLAAADAPICALHPQYWRPLKLSLAYK